MKIPDKNEHERAFIKRLNTVHSGLRKSAPNVKWVEATEENGTIVLYLTEPVLWNSTSQGCREIRITRPVCMNCRRDWVEHAPSGGKCLFGPTSYGHD